MLSVIDAVSFPLSYHDDAAGDDFAGRHWYLHDDS